MTGDLRRISVVLFEGFELLDGARHGNYGRTLFRWAPVEG